MRYTNKHTVDYDVAQNSEWQPSVCLSVCLSVCASLFLMICLARFCVGQTKNCLLLFSLWFVMMAYSLNLQLFVFFFWDCGSCVCSISPRHTFRRLFSRSTCVCSIDPSPPSVSEESHWRQCDRILHFNAVCRYSSVAGLGFVSLGPFHCA